MLPSFAEVWDGEQSLRHLIVFQQQQRESSLENVVKMTEVLADGSHPPTNHEPKGILSDTEDRPPYSSIWSLGRFAVSLLTGDRKDQQRDQETRGTTRNTQSRAATLHLSGSSNNLLLEPTV
ncbi:MAG: hypothetical protein M2R45_00914 [Verrucomicrobia subdivision 3 bacterium]|nr:hypothetical protein [Limisphaerales bacterium]MCS1414583.1 hypothetical protein [Limisphaerales bacterium]